MKIVKRVLSAMVSLLLAVVILSNGYLLIARFLLHIEDPSIFGYRFAVVMSGSMEPVLSTGDFVVVKTRDSYDVGDVIMFHEEEILVTHRIVGQEDGKFITKGDANNVEDEGRVDPAAIRGEMVLAIPHVGLAMIPQTFSRYVTQLTGTAVFETAAQVNNTSTMSLRRGGAYQVENLPRPGESETIVFSVTNYKGAKVSDVAQDYHITVTTTGNLPLIFTLKAVANSNPTAEPQFNCLLPGSEESTGVRLFEDPLVWGNGAAEQSLVGGQMPYGEPVAHTYALTITCPEGLTYEENREIDEITVRFQAEQYNSAK